MHPASARNRNRTRTRAVRLPPASATSKGTLEADANAYLATVEYKASYKSQRAELAAWVALYGHLRRSQIGPEHVRKARATWAADDYAPKTINNRTRAGREAGSNCSGW